MVQKHTSCRGNQHETKTHRNGQLSIKQQNDASTYFLHRKPAWNKKSRETVSLRQNNKMVQSILPAEETSVKQKNRDSFAVFCFLPMLSTECTYFSPFDLFVLSSSFFLCFVADALCSLYVLCSIIFDCLILSSHALCVLFHFDTLCSLYVLHQLADVFKPHLFVFCFTLMPFCSMCVLCKIRLCI